MGTQKEKLPRGVAEIWFEKANLGGPGGQHRNKSENDRIAHAVLTDPALIEHFGAKEATAQSRGRSADQNEKAAEAALREKVADAWTAVEQKRREEKRKRNLAKRREPRGAKERRIKKKKQRSEIKKLRRKPKRGDW